MSPWQSSIFSFQFGAFNFQCFICWILSAPQHQDQHKWPPERTQLRTQQKLYALESSGHNLEKQQQLYALNITWQNLHCTTLCSTCVYLVLYSWKPHLLSNLQNMRPHLKFAPNQLMVVATNCHQPLVQLPLLFHLAPLHHHPCLVELPHLHLFFLVPPHNRPFVFHLQQHGFWYWFFNNVPPP